MPTSASYLQTLLSLGAVLALFLACAWFIKRLQRPQSGANNPLRLRGQLMLGTRERIVLIEVADQWIVAGIAGGNIRPLAVLPCQEAAEPQVKATPHASTPDFGSILKHLGKP